MESRRMIVLASGSPRRKELLEKLGLKFTVVPSDSAEEFSEELDPLEQAKQMSLNKAKTVAKKYPDAIIIAADTFGILRRKIIGKPHTADEAMRMLQAMSGKSHRVITGFTILDTLSGKIVTRAAETRVYFKKLTQSEIAAYVETGEPLDKAGAYAIQGSGALLVDKINGDYYNVVGLPIKAVAEDLLEFGIKIL